MHKIRPIAITMVNGSSNRQVIYDSNDNATANGDDNFRNLCTILYNNSPNNMAKYVSE